MQTTTIKRIICLANSRKRNGSCVAGRELLQGGQVGGWIRPVSDRENEEVSPSERQYENGGDPRVLDIMDVPLLGANPKNYQQENWRLNPTQRWKRVGRVTWNELMRFTDLVPQLWVNGHSTYNGLNDRIPVHVAYSLDTSLCLIKIDELELYVSAPGRDFGNYRRRLQGRFRYMNEDYWLRVTDLVYEQRYIPEGDGTYNVGENFLTISLGEPYDGNSYKLIAAIIEP